jgi:ribonuclease P protein component
VSGSFAFPRARRLRRSQEIRTVFRSGRRQRCGPIDLFLLADPDRRRAAIIVPRHGQTAVARNRLKRRLREIVRLDWLPAACGGDLVVRARPGAYASSFDELRASLQACFERIRC